jgi:O-antigen ligase
MAVSALFGEAAPLVALAIPLAPILAVAVIARPLVGVIVVIATLPLGSLGVPAGPITLQASEIAVFIVAALVILRRLALSETPLPWSPLFAFPLALLAWTLVALYSAVDETLAVKQIAALSGGAVFAAAVLASCTDMRDVRRVLGMLLLVGGTIALLALSSGGGHFRSTYGGTVVGGRLEGPFDHPNTLGSFCAIGATIAVGLASGARMRRSRVAAGVALALLLTALALTLSRGAWIGTAVGFVFLLVTLKEARRMLSVFLIPVAAFGFIVWSSAPDRPELRIVGERASAITKRSPYDGRDEIWGEAIREIKDDPITGQGPGSFPVASLRADSETSSVAPPHAHNMLLNWAAENGVPAAVLIVGFAFALGIATRRATHAALARGDPRDRAVVLTIAAALLTVMAHGIFDYSLGNTALHITVWALIGALLVARREADRGYGSAR